MYINCKILISYIKKKYNKSEVIIDNRKHLSSIIN